MNGAVYIDVLFITNAIIAYFILRASKSLCNEKADIICLILAACMAGFFSFIILLNISSKLLLWCGKLAMALIICVVAEKSVMPRRVIKLTLWYILLNTMLAGVCFGIMYYVHPDGIVINNLTLYFNISPLTLLLCVLIMYLIIKVITAIFTKPQENVMADITFVCGTVGISCTALVDSGFNVQDSLCGTAPFLLSLPQMRGAIPQTICNGVDAFNGKADAAFVTYIYPICVQTASGSKALPAVKVQSFTIKIGNKTDTFKNCAAIFSNETFADGSFEAIVGMKLAKNVL